MTGSSCLVVLAALRGQEAGGDHVASGTVVLVKDVQATFVIIAGVVGRLRGLASGLVKQSLFLDALLLALSGLAAASVVASLFVSGHDAQLVGEAALVAGVAGGAGDGSVTGEWMREDTRTYTIMKKKTTWKGMRNRNMMKASMVRRALKSMCIWRKSCCFGLVVCGRVEVVAVLGSEYEVLSCDGRPAHGTF